MRRADENALSLRAFLDLRYAAGGSPLTQLLSQRIGAVLAWAAYRIGLSPSSVTLGGISTFLGGAVLYALLPAGPGATACCFVVFQLGYGIDCADGQLARATHSTSRFGAWLDVACDYLRNIFLALALAQHLIFRGFATEVSTVIAGLLLSGNVVKLHTVSTLRGFRGEESRTDDAQTSMIRSLGKLGLDTAMHLTFLSLLRDFPWLLICYASGVGGAYLTLAYAQVRQRLR